MNHLDRQIELGIVCCFGGGGGGSNTVAPTPEMNEQAAINTELWDYYNTTYKPQIEKYAEMKTDPNISKGEKNQIAGQVNAEVMRKVPQGGAQNPVNTARELTKVSSVGSAADTQAMGAARSRTLSGMQNVVDIGRGQATSADIGLRELAGQSVRTAISNAATNQMKEEATDEAWGSVAGAAAAGLLKYKKPTPAATPVGG